MFERVLRISFICLACVFACIGQFTNYFMISERQRDLNAKFQKLKLPILSNAVGILTIMYYLGRILGFWVSSFLITLKIKPRTIIGFYILGCCICHLLYSKEKLKIWHFEIITFINGIFQIDYLLLTIMKQFYRNYKAFKILYLIIISEIISKLLSCKFGWFVLKEQNYSIFNYFIGLSLFFLSFIVYMAIQEEKEILKKKLALLKESLEDEETQFLNLSSKINDNLLEDFYYQSLHNMQVHSLNKNNKKKFIPKIPLKDILSKNRIDEEGEEIINTSPAIKMNLNSIRKDLEQGSNRRDNNKSDIEYYNNKMINFIENKQKKNDYLSDIDVQDSRYSKKDSDIVKLMEKNKNTLSDKNEPKLVCSSKSLIEEKSLSKIEHISVDREGDQEEQLFSVNNLIDNFFNEKKSSQYLQTKKFGLIQINEFMNKNIMIPLILNQFIISLIFTNALFQEDYITNRYFDRISIKNQNIMNIIGGFMIIFPVIGPFFNSWAELSKLKTAQIGFAINEIFRIIIFSLVEKKTSEYFYFFISLNFFLLKIFYTGCTAIFFVLLSLRKYDENKEIFVIGLSNIVCIILPKIIILGSFMIFQLELSNFKIIQEMQIGFSFLATISLIVLIHIEKEID